MSDPEECQDRRESIVALVLGELDAIDVEELNQHLNTCDVCRGFREALADEETTVRSAFDAIARGVGPIEHRIVERIDDSETQPGSQAVPRWVQLVGGLRTMKRPYKILAATASVTVVLTGLGAWFLPGDHTAGIAFADVLEQIRLSRPYACVSTTQYEGRRPSTRRLMLLSLTRRREIWPDGSIHVFDLSGQDLKILSLYPKRKIAIEETILGAGPRRDPDLLAIVAAKREAKAEDLGTRQINGRLAQGFHAPGKANDFTVWADARTGLPIRIELRQESLGRTITMHAFEFDVDFDESLFSTTAPDGYTVRKVQQDAGTATRPVAADLAERIRGLHPYVCTRTVQEKGKPDRTCRIMRLNLSRRREILPDGRIVIWNLSRDPTQCLTLFPKEKRATETTGSKGPSKDPDLLKMAFTLQDGTEEDLGVRQIEGRNARGFRSMSWSGNELTFWIDAETDLPVRLEIVHTNVGRKIILSDFEFTADLDESLFSTAVPDGYTLRIAPPW